ncbi:MAG: hypothetical protein CR986_05485 [Ignavibacteriae bacterium]|nr:MAG: hypothetical protein CR986_05485 [Ignavibacteriota bacterium]
MSKIIQTIIVLSLSTFLLFAQVDKNNTSKVDNNFYKISKALNKKWEKLNVKNGYNENGKVPFWKINKRWEWYWEQRVDLNSGEFPNTNSIAEFEKVKKVLHKSENYNENWINLGTSSSTGGYSGIGRINCIAFHPTDANIFWVGSPSGGIWRTTDGGSSWEILNNNESTIGVSAIAVTNNFSTSNTLFIATGDRDGGSMWSLNGGQRADNVATGVYKSTDGGTTWSATDLTFPKSNGRKIYSLIIHPTNNNILIASTNSGIYKTSNGGTTWARKYDYVVTDLEFKPDAPNIIYGARIDYSSNPSIQIVKSTDGGENWSNSANFSGARGEIAVTPADPNIVYVVACNNQGGIANVYKSINSADNFTGQINPAPAGDDGKSYFGYYSDGSGTNTGQGYYDICIAVSPTDANTVFIGGINTWKSTDGGVTWSINNMWTSYSVYNMSNAPVVHADKHCLEFNGSTTLYECNDGGIYKTTNGGTSWTDLTNGMVISQIYRLSNSQTNANYILTGLQDNGTKLRRSTNWIDVYGGDGMECIIDYSDNDVTYLSYVNGQIYRNTDGFSTNIREKITGNISNGQPDGAWVTPYIIDPTDSKTLYAGFDRVWKTSDRGDSWTEISQVLSPDPQEKIRSLAISPANTNIMLAADKHKMWKTTDGGATDWTELTTLPSSNHMITYITMHATDENIAWYTVGGYTNNQKVYETTDGGNNWTNISAGLPNLPIMCLVHYNRATSRNVLFVGTDVGVYIKDGDNDWALYNSGLPNVVVTELDIFYNNSGADKLRAATYGRGLWETDIDAALPVELTLFNASLIKENISLTWQTATEVNNYGFEIQRKSGKSEWEKIGFIKGTGNSNSPKNYEFTDFSLTNGNKFLYRLKLIDIDGQFDYSKEIEVNYLPNQFLLKQNYPNPFNPTTSISYILPEKTFVTLTIYNSLGQVVNQLINNEQDYGAYKVNFDASKLSSGVYYYTIKTNKFTETKKMMLIK